MSTIDLAIELDANDKRQMLAASTFFSILAGGVGQTTVNKPAEPKKKQEPLETLQVVTEDISTEEEETKSDAPHPASTWEDDQMQDMKVSELKAACDEIGIDYMSVEGKNTNAKLRRCILGHFSGTEVQDTDATQKGVASSSDTEEDEEITRDLLRKLVPKYAKAGHRDTMLAKLQDLGVPNVTQLKEEDFKAFHDFLMALDIE